MLWWEHFQTAQFWLALGSIILIDLVLAGDNAIVIALAARRLPRAIQRRAIILGTIGAITVRVLLTLVAVSLLRIPGLMLIGGTLLFWIAYKLLVQDEENHSPHYAATTLRQALQTILIADTIMGMDNVIGIAGAANGNFVLVILGLLISIPLVVWGSTLVLNLLKKFPLLIYLGAAVLVITAVHMIFKDALLAQIFVTPTWLAWLAHIVMLVIILGLGYRRRQEISEEKN